jgi:16S rRNA (guanine527-N7)-methyltransferase
VTYSAIKTKTGIPLTITRSLYTFISNYSSIYIKNRCNYKIKPYQISRLSGLVIEKIFIILYHMQTIHDQLYRKDLIDQFLLLNSQINLSAIRTADGVFHKHILDSLKIHDSIDLSGAKNLLDIGTGGGFPLLPLAHTLPDTQCFGLDTRKKKCDAISALATTLWYTNVSLIRSRAEEHKYQYDVVTARAVAYADLLFTRTAPLVKPWGKLIWRKMYSDEEDAYIHKNYSKYGLKSCVSHSYDLGMQDDMIQRVLYVFRREV